MSPARAAVVISTTIAAFVPGAGDGAVNGMVKFDSQHHYHRSGLAEAGGRIYVTFAANEDPIQYHVWLIAYRAVNVQQQTLATHSFFLCGAGRGLCS
ncbi:MAG: hypothetical protein LAP86_19685 [Acidobacteriia bacterium]|nr:hypothetical protein [Terriglobia bacterium]